MRSNSSTASREAGFSLIELMIVLLVASILMAIAIPLMREALLRAHIGAATAEARAVHSAFKRYHIDQSMYPDASGLNNSSLAPLTTLGYYDGGIGKRIVGATLDGYDAPNNGEEYWLEFTLEYDPRVRFLVSDSDDGPLGGGAFYDGITLFRSGQLVPL